MPARVSVIEKVEPVYERLPGWKTSTFGVSSYDELPARAKDYLAFLERHTGVDAPVRVWNRCCAKVGHASACPSSAGGRMLYAARRARFGAPSLLCWPHAS
jgi:hypothetical protein